MTPRNQPPAKGTRGRALYDARTRLGLSQAEIARRVGTDRRSYIRWEKNQTRPGADFSESLAEALEIPVSAILDPSVAHVRRSQDSRVARLLREAAGLRAELAECRRENRELERQLAKLAS